MTRAGRAARRSSRASLAPFAVLAAACAAHPPRPVLEEEPFVLSAEAAPALEAPSPSGGAGAHFRVPEARAALSTAARTGRTPVVSARVGGVPGAFLVDTGAFDHLLYASAAARIVEADSTGKAGAVVDHGNRRVATERFGEVSFEIPGWSALAPIRPMVIEDRASDPSSGRSRVTARISLAGMLSPQRLLLGAARGTTAAEVISVDLPAHELVGETEEDGEARLKARATFVGIAPRCGDTYVATATVDGKEARLIVDTGSFTTDLKAHSEPGQALAGRTSPAREIYGVGGAIGSRMLQGARVRIGPLATTLDVPIIDDAGGRSACPHDGVLGMDVLFKCVVVLDREKARIACDG